MTAEGGGPVKDTLVKLSHLVDGEIDERYRDFVEVLTDEYGEAQLQVRVQDPKWTGLTQHFRVTVEKKSTRLDKPDLVHEFEPSFQDVTVRHLGQGTFEFTDTTSRVNVCTDARADGASYARRWPAAYRRHFLTHPHLVSVLRAGATAFTPSPLSDPS